MWRIEFTTEQFAPYLPEEAQQNPGAYGFELADWLARNMARRGHVTSYPVGEDWGWFIEYTDGRTEIMIGCSSEASEGDGHSGRPIAWRVFVRQPRSLRQKLAGVAVSSKVTELAGAIEAVLKEEGIHVSRTEA